MQALLRAKPCMTVTAMGHTHEAGPKHKASDLEQKILLVRQASLAFGFTKALFIEEYKQGGK